MRPTLKLIFALVFVGGGIVALTEALLGDQSFYIVVAGCLLAALALIVDWERDLR